jgi:putative copper export protein
LVTVADAVAIGLRVFAYAAALQAAGQTFFIQLYGLELDRTRQTIRAAATSTTIAAVVLTLLSAATEPARLTGELSGILDRAMLVLVLTSDMGTAITVRILGLGMIVCGSLLRSPLGRTASLIGAAIVMASFAFVGHTASDDRSWLLAPLLIFHLLIVAFWFGALWPLMVVAQREKAATAHAVIEQFSSVALWLVPMIFLAGLAIAMLLLPDLSSVSTPYGRSLLWKVAGFAALLGLAALNRWRLGPGLATGDSRAQLAFRLSVLLEWIVIFAVVTVSAVMTALFSPEQ